MFCQDHSKEEIKAVNIDPNFKYNRLACLECLLESPEIVKAKKNFIRINKLTQNPEMILNSEYFNCVISRNLLFVQQEDLKNVLKYINQTILKIKQSINSAIDNLANSIDNQLLLYQKECQTAITLILDKIGWPNLKDSLDFSKQSDKEFNYDQLNHIIKELNDSYKNLEHTYYYVSLKQELIKSFTEQRKHLLKEVEQSISISKRALEQIKEQTDIVFSNSKMVEEKQLEMTQKYEQRCHKRALKEQQEQDQKQQLEAIACLSSLLIPQSYRKICSVLFDRIKLEMNRIPSLTNIEHYSQSKFKTFGDKLKELKSSSYTNFIIVIEIEQEMIGCYYPASEHQKSDILFGCNQEKQEVQLILREKQYKRNIELTYDELVNRFTKTKDLLGINLASSKILIQEEGLLHCWFNPNNTEFISILKMSIMKFD